MKLSLDEPSHTRSNLCRRFLKIVLVIENGKGTGRVWENGNWRKVFDLDMSEGEIGNLECFVEV
jgi:hypothetical protein